MSTPAAASPCLLCSLIRTYEREPDTTINMLVRGTFALGALTGANGIAMQFCPECAAALDRLHAARAQWLQIVDLPEGPAS